MQNILKEIQFRKIVPVIQINEAKSAKELAEALCRGGLPIAEITFRTPAAQEAISLMKKNNPDMLIGAGTILSVEQADRALCAGASFLVSPGFQQKIVEFAIAHNIPIIPGACTPTELMYLSEFDLPVAKFFPAENYGGIHTLQSLSAPFPEIQFMPTGGINPINLPEYLKISQVIACGGSWMATGKMIDDCSFELITKLTKEAVQLAGGSCDESIDYPNVSQNRK